VLGRLHPDRFLGGELRLQVAAAAAAIERIAGPLGFQGSDGLVRMADGVLSLSTVIMAGAIKQISIEHGLDPREFVLFCYGGGGPLHASAPARELSIPTVVIPPEPGNFSAVGMLLADARLDLSKTFVGALAQSTVASLKAAFAEMEGQARAALVQDFGARNVLFERHAEMRYTGQRHNIKVPISGIDDLAGIRRAFDRDYKRRYGHADPKAAAELQALHLSGFTRLRRPELARLPRAPTSSVRVPEGRMPGSMTARRWGRGLRPPARP
jgi:N-methylhydantoinase A